MLSLRRSMQLTIAALWFATSSTGCDKKKEDTGGPSGETPVEGGGANRKPKFFGDEQYAALRAADQNNLKQIGMALHNYADAYNGLLPPAAICDAKGKPLLSWRVAILPFIEQQPLYMQFKLDEPWDSENNKKLIPLMPKIYVLPGSGSETEGYTNYRVFAGVPSVCREFIPMFNWPEPKFPQKLPQINIGSIVDGTSNTIMVAESAEAVIWTKPDEMIYDPKQPLPKLGYFWKETSNILLGDGSYRAVTRKLSEKTLRLAISRQDGQILGSDW